MQNIEESADIVVCGSPVQRSEAEDVASCDGSASPEQRLGEFAVAVFCCKEKKLGWVGVAVKFFGRWAVLHG